MQFLGFLEAMNRRVKSVRIGMLTASLLLSAGGPLVTAGAAQDSEDVEAPPPIISVGQITGTPGASLMIPLYYTPDPDNPMKSITVEIDYVSNNLKYLKLSPGLAAERVNADIAGVLTDGEASAEGLTRSTLRVDASVIGNDPVPEGLLAYLLFQISLEAKPFAIEMNTSVTSAQNLQGEAAVVNAQDGLVVVELLDAMPEASCFFFTH